MARKLLTTGVLGWKKLLLWSVKKCKVIPQRKLQKEEEVWGVQQQRELAWWIHLGINLLPEKIWRRIVAPFISPRLEVEPTDRHPVQSASKLLKQYSDQHTTLQSRVQLQIEIQPPYHEDTADKVKTRQKEESQKHGEFRQRCGSLRGNPPNTIQCQPEKDKFPICAWFLWRVLLLALMKLFLAAVAFGLLNWNLMLWLCAFDLVEPVLTCFIVSNWHGKVSLLNIAIDPLFKLISYAMIMARGFSPTAPSTFHTICLFLRRDVPKEDSELYTTVAARRTEYQPNRSAVNLFGPSGYGLKSTTHIAKFQRTSEETGNYIQQSRFNLQQIYYRFMQNKCPHTEDTEERSQVSTEELVLSMHRCGSLTGIPPYMREITGEIQLENTEAAEEGILNMRIDRTDGI